ncbi:MAG: hypothetical protein G01um101419_77 [Parcubacteria group bacterium Gr01-1014_19]|nr:MAG: hypothetical protein G01um101419_77 [Parcubacteria group bacterium Gr01-1014_19]
MCVSLAPAHLSKTILYVGEALVDRKNIHVLGYQNRAQNLAPGANAMILPFPAEYGSMTPKNILSTKDCPNILKDMERALTPVRRTLSLGADSMTRGAKGIVQVFQHDIYTIVLAEDARDIPGALKLVPKDKRPKLNKKIFDAYAKWYPGWAIALCCFNNKDSAEAKPMLWWYDAVDHGNFFAPALDCHTGDVPDLTALVDVDHTIVTSMKTEKFIGSPVFYRDQERISPEVRAYLPEKVEGRMIQGRIPNGDFFIRKLDFYYDGKLTIDRYAPRGMVIAKAK